MKHRWTYMAFLAGMVAGALTWPRAVDNSLCAHLSKYREVVTVPVEYADTSNRLTIFIAADHANEGRTISCAVTTPGGEPYKFTIQR